jgi:RNA polymerase sigma-70 factor (ECF subfamily)
MRGLAKGWTMRETTVGESAVGAPVHLPTSRARFTDRELVERAVDGDAWAEEALYRRYADLVIGTAKRLLGSRDEAADVAQDAFLVAFEKLSTLKDAATFKTWLMQIAVHGVHRRFRRRRLLRWLGLDRDAEEGALEALAAVDAAPDVRAELAALDHVLRTLAPSVRLPWMLRYVEGHELTEVASLSGCSLATVKRRIAEAQARIARHFGEEVFP